MITRGEVCCELGVILLVSWQCWERGLLEGSRDGGRLCRSHIRFWGVLLLCQSGDQVRSTRDASVVWIASKTVQTVYGDQESDRVELPVQRLVKLCRRSEGRDGNERVDRSTSERPHIETTTTGRCVEWREVSVVETTSVDGVSGSTHTPEIEGLGSEDESGASGRK